MNIKSMPISERIPLIFESSSTIIISKSIVYFVMDKNNLCSSSHLICMSTFIFTLFGMEGLCSSMGHYFLLGCVSLCSWVTVWISYSPCVISCLIMITLYRECKMSCQGCSLIILLIKVCSMFNIAQIRKQRITYKTQHQIENIKAHTNSYDCPDL